MARKKIGWIGSLAIIFISGVLFNPPAVQSNAMPFTPGERLKYELRWENIPAGEALLAVESIKDLNGTPAYHFVMTARSNAFVDLFYKVRDRIDAYTDTRMTRSILYQKKQREGEHLREERIEFDWQNGQALYSNYGKTDDPVELMPGSFDPLSAFYFTRMALAGEVEQVQRPVTDGKKNIIGRARIIGREMITLKNGMTFDTYCIEPDMRHIGGVFKESEDARIRIWVTADDKRMPVQIKSKVAVGHFIGELVSAEGINVNVRP